VSAEFQPGDVLMVTSVNHETGALELERIGDGPRVELVRIENEHGQVAYLSREEYEGRKNGTWVTMLG